MWARIGRTSSSELLLESSATDRGDLFSPRAARAAGVCECTIAIQRPPTASEYGGQGGLVEASGLHWPSRVYRRSPRFGHFPTCFCSAMVPTLAVLPLPIETSFPFAASLARCAMIARGEDIGFLFEVKMKIFGCACVKFLVVFKIIGFFNFFFSLRFFGDFIFIFKYFVWEIFGCCLKMKILLKDDHRHFIF
jgi:hypothetical protein